MSDNGCVCVVPECKEAMEGAGVRFETGERLWLCGKHVEDMHFIQAEIRTQAAVVVALATASQAENVRVTRLYEETVQLAEMQERRLLYLEIAGFAGTRR